MPKWTLRGAITNLFQPSYRPHLIDLKELERDFLSDLYRAYISGKEPVLRPCPSILGTTVPWTPEELAAMRHNREQAKRLREHIGRLRLVPDADQPEPQCSIRPG
jgi:hypothetical protein